MLKHMFPLAKTDLLGALWEWTEDQAADLRDQSIAISKGYSFHTLEYQKHLKLWDHAEQLSKKADKIFAK